MGPNRTRATEPGKWMGLDNTPATHPGRCPRPEGPPAQARAAMGRIAAALPAELRPAFLERGHLAAAPR
jgi:hypothetical protein